MRGGLHVMSLGVRLSLCALLAGSATATYANEASGKAIPASAASAEPKGYRTGTYRAPTPASLKGAKTVSSAEAMTLWKSNAALFIDVLPRPQKPDNLPAQTVWHVPGHRNIPGSAWLPNTGYGVLSPEMTAYFETQLKKLTNGDKTAPLLIYCLKDCWMSWNAAKRAIEIGYRAVYWFPDGTDGWTAVGGALTPAMPVEPFP